MKKLLAITLVSTLATVGSHGQGTVSFKNYFGNPNTDPAVYFAGHTTKVSGSQYLVALMAGSTSGSEAQVATTPFLTATAAAGFFQAGTVAIPTVTGGGTAFIRIDVWDTTLNGTTTGATYAQAQAYSTAHPTLQNLYGHSTEFALVTGNPNGNPPTVPTFLVPGLTSFELAIPIPEPSTFTLAGLGAAALMLFRCRK